MCVKQNKCFRAAQTLSVPQEGLLELFHPKYFLFPTNSGRQELDIYQFDMLYEVGLLVSTQKCHEVSILAPLSHMQCGRRLNGFPPKLLPVGLQYSI